MAALTVRKRIVATALELVPLIPLALLPGATNEQEPWIVVLPFASGLGWALVGKWDIGFAIWLARFLILGGAFVVVGFFAWGVADCADCSQIPAYVAFGVVIALYVVSTLLSAFFVARVSPARVSAGSTRG